MTDIDAVNGVILDALNEVADRYRRSGAPIVVYNEGDTSVVRIASIEFAVTTMVNNGQPTSLRPEFVKNRRERGASDSRMVGPSAD